MKKDKFIECAKLMMEEHDKYCSIVKDAEKIYLNKLSELDKRYKTKIFTKQTIAEKNIFLVGMKHICQQNFMLKTM